MRWGQMRTATLLAALAGGSITVIGCMPSGNDGPDDPCNQSSDCQSSLQCVAPALVMPDGGSCKTLDKRCTKTCTSDSDCNNPGGGSCSLTSCDGQTRYCLANHP